MRNNTRKFVQMIVILTFALSAWVTYTTISWMVGITLSDIVPMIAGIAFGVPSVLITLMFSIFKGVFTQYTETGLKLLVESNAKASE